MPRLTPARATTIAMLLAAVALGFALRLIPSWRGADAYPLSDRMFHLRMTQAISDRWRLPRVDSLACAPVGREVGRMLPTGLYWAAGAFHRAAAALDYRDLLTHARLFVALAGALVALPAYGAARALYRGRTPALVAALVAVILPAHLHRSFGYWFRYDALGTLLIATHVALSLAALAAPNRTRARAASVGAALALVAALAVWRVALMLPVLEVVFVLLYTLLRPPGAPLREWWSAQVLGGTLACLLFAYLREQSFVLSGAWLLAIGLAAALWTPWLRREGAPPARRAGLLALVALAAALGGRLAGRERPYAEVLDAALRKVVETLGVHSIPSPTTMIALSVDELQSVSLAELLGAGSLSWLGVPFLLAPLVWLVARRRSGGIRASLEPGPALLTWLSAALLVGTLLFSRNKIVLGPLAAIVIGGLFAALAPARPPAPASRTRGIGAGSTTRTIARALLAMCMLATAWDAITLALTRESRMEPGERSAMAFLTGRTPPDAVVLAPWERGYEIQGYAGRKTVLDGLLEDPLNQRRIVEVARAWMAPRTDSLVALCKRTGTDYLLVPPSTALHGIAVLTDWPATWKLRAGIPLGRTEADRVLVRMMVLGESPPPFEQVFQSEGWRVYRRAE
ncbi:MAG: hypothetical protein ACRENJ_07480 [Candidatus Eiseniibacteriota bacterium]